MSSAGASLLTVERELYQQLKKYRREICFRVPLIYYLIYRSLSEEAKEKVRKALAETFEKVVEELTETSVGNYIVVKEKKQDSV